MLLNTYVHFFRYEIYVLLNIAAVFLTVFFKNSTIAKLSFFTIAAVFLLNLPLVADVVYYNEGFIGNGYSGSKYEYLWRLPQSILSNIGLNAYILSFFRILVLMILVLLLKFQAGTYLALASNASVLITQNGLRQGISSLIVCFIFTEVKLYRMIFFSVAAGLFHSSGFVFGIIATVFTISCRKENKKYFEFDGQYLCYGYIAIMFLLAFISPILIASTGYGNYYRIDGEMSGRVTGVYKYLLYLIDVMCLVLLSFKFKDHKTPIIGTSSLCLVTLSIVLGFYWGAHDLASRLLLTATIWITVGYCFIFSNVSKYRSRVLLALFVAARSVLSLNVIKLLSL